MKSDHELHEIGVAVQTWLWVQVNHVLIAQSNCLNGLNCLNGVQWLWVQIQLTPTFYSYFKGFLSGKYDMYLFIPLHSCDNLEKISIKIIMVTDKSNTRNKIWHWTNNEIEIAVKSWLWVQIELMVWWLSQLKYLTGVQWLWVQIPLQPTFYSYFKGSLSCE